MRKKSVKASRPTNECNERIQKFFGQCLIMAQKTTPNNAYI
jgi:hypothetical protein